MQRLCQDCGEKISAERLKVMPNAHLCTSCKRDWEADRKKRARLGPATEVPVQKKKTVRSIHGRRWSKLTGKEKDQLMDELVETGEW